MKDSFIYIRGLKTVDHTVFAVEDGQKKYWDEQFQKQVAYSGGQQVKRNIIQGVLDELNLDPAPITFYFEGDKLKEKEVTSPGNPIYIDQLLAGWMIAQAGGNDRTIKRRSPLSISALRPLHPLLSIISKEDVSFDRSDRPNIHKVVVKSASGNILTEEEIADLLKGSNRSLLRKWIADNKRTSGLFVYDVAIDLRTLFSISTNLYEPELSESTISELKTNGWIESSNVFGKCLTAPKTFRDKVIPALAKSILNWRIATNQSRTFSIMSTLAVAISKDASKLSDAIRAKLSDETEKLRAIPIVDNTIDLDLFITLACEGYIAGAVGSANALADAEKKLIEYLSLYNFEGNLN